MSHQIVVVLLLLTALCLSMEVEGSGRDETLDALEQEVQRLKNRVTSLEQLYEPSASGPVFFLASKASSTTPQSNSVIIFDLLEENGIGYNPTTGTFTAPLSGIYLFHVSAAAHSHIEVQIMKDDIPLATAFDQGRWAQGSNMIIVHMHRGEKVWVLLLSGDIAGGADPYTLFTGALLVKD